MYKNHANTDGFTVTYAPYPASAFTGWADEVHTFGTTTTTSHLQTETFDSEIAALETCVDDHGPDHIISDFEGLYFTELDGDYISIAPGCAPRDSWDLTNRRLIGFHVKVGDY